MNDAKYIGLDVHQATISAAILDSTCKQAMECVLETKADTILQFVHGLRGSLHVTREEGTCAAWLHDLLKSHVTRLVVCDPRKNACMKEGNKSDKIDARRLAELVCGNLRGRFFGTWVRVHLTRLWRSASKGDGCVRTCEKEVAKISEPR
jgi:hypothetical protein